MNGPTRTPPPPYYAVIFTSRRADDDVGYDQTAARMMDLARQAPGFLGVESSHEAQGGVTVSYWASLEAIDAWRRDVEHTEARRQGRARWYEAFTLRVARVERASDFGLDP